MPYIKVTSTQHAVVAKIMAKYDHFMDRAPHVAAALDITREDREALNAFLKLKEKTI